MVEVVALHNHVVKFQEAEPLLHALFVAFRGQHPVDAEAGTHLAQQLDVVQVHQPVGVVEHHRFAFTEFDEAFHLALEALGVVVNVLFCQHLAHIGAAGWVADHGGAAADQRDRTVARLLQALHQGQRHKVAGGQAICCTVEADVKGRLAAVNQFLDLFLVGHLCNQAATFELVVDCHLLFLQFDL